MKGPHTKDEHYVYGKPSPINQPYPAYYNSSWYHRKPPRRYLSDMIWFMDDGSSYTIDNRPADPNAKINRSLSRVNILNIETIAVHSLRIKLYGPTEEDDIDLTLEIGNTYDIMYVTEGGLKVARGVLKIIDSSIPDTCTRYIGEFNPTINTAYIGLDCSTEGHSDKRKIYIASIRNIQKVEEDTEDMVAINDPTDSEKLDSIMKLLPSMDSKLDQLICKLFAHDKNITTRLENMDPNQKIDYISAILEKVIGLDKIIFDNITDESGKILDNGVVIISTIEDKEKLNKK